MHVAPTTVPRGPAPETIDEEDGRPRWDPAPGSPLVPGLLAWGLMDLGPRRETWLCWSLDLWAPAVVKIVRPGVNPEWAEALDFEVRALTALAHPAVPRLLLDGRSGEPPYVAVEYLDGPSLDLCVEADGRFPATDTARLGVLVLGALRALHATGHAHLDVSPNNILLVDRRPRLVDLGGSHPLGEWLPPDEKLGTEGFFAPELDDPSGAVVAPAMDVYSVGATLHEVVDPASEGAEQVDARLAAMADPDPARRPSVEVAMSSLAYWSRKRGVEPWPRWADAHLPRPPRLRRKGWRGEGSAALGNAVAG